MKLLDEEPWAWHLLEDDDGALYLNAVCSQSFVDYYFLMKLDEDELRHFHREGRAYLTELAYDVHYSAPGVVGSRSRFKARGLTPMLGGSVIAALDAARKATDAR